MNSKNLSLAQFNPVAAAFGLCLLYWTYLAGASQMIINHDAIGYEWLGSIINKNGWVEYFKTGPNREPFYPWTISMSMGLASLFSISYQTVQILFQIFLLLITQLLMLVFLKKLGVRRWLCAAVILYLGFSPSIVNSTFILYSEILSYPFVLSLLWISVESWRTLQTSKNLKTILLWSFALGINFVILTMIKASFEIITPLFLIIFVLMSRNLQKGLAFLVIALLTFYIPVTGYKFLNKKFNDNFILTDRGAWALYGNTARRVEPATAKDVASALAFVPSWRFCIDHMGQDNCYRWSFLYSDQLGAAKRQELERQKLPTEEINKTLIDLSKTEILKNPFQYGLFYFFESLKMFFWEFPTMDYVIYPDGAVNLYKLKIVSIGSRVIMPIVTFFSVLYPLIFLYKNRKNRQGNDESLKILLLGLFLIFLYILTLSFFQILPRYIFPLAPVYLIFFAFAVEQILNELII